MHTHTRGGGEERQMYINVATQNVGGLGLEVRTNKRKGLTGPKLQYISQCVSHHSTDILVLTETRAKTNEESNQTRIKKSNLRVTMSTSSGRASAGVTVLTGSNISLVENSVRESTPTGHYILGVYKVQGTILIIGGIYLDSTGQEQVGIDALQNLSTHITELKQLYGTNCVILTGDFNVTLFADQCHSGRINKPRTSQELHDLLEEHGLNDAGGTHNMVTPTYRRHGDAGVYSRIDYLFSSLATAQFHTGWGPLDHAYLTAQIGLPMQHFRQLPKIKDWIIGSEQFLRLGREQIINTLIDHDISHTVISPQEKLNMINMGIPGGFERRIQITSPADGITEMHVLNVIIRKLQTLAGKLARQDKDRMNQIITTTDNALKELHTTLQTGHHLTEQERQDINTRITELKMHLRDRLTQRATQDDARVDTFHNIERGRMTKCSFVGIQEKKTHRLIDKLVIDGQEITDQDVIVQVMRDRYMACTGQERLIEDNAVTTFLDDMDITLPRLTEDQQEQVGAEITSDEVRQALQSAKAHSAPGPSGQTLGFFKYIFAQIPHIFTRCMNLVAFCDDILDSSALAWIKQRKVIYIPKPGKDPLSPSSYRPLSLLEVLYKIPAKILTDRIGLILPSISYEDQCGFVPGRGAQYNTLTAGHAVQDAENTGHSLQMLGVDISSAFDSISGECIRQCMLANGFPMHVVLAVHNLTKLGMAQVEVNGKKGEIFVQKSGVGQGDPLSAFRFNIGTEPLLRALRRRTENIVYRDVAGTAICPAAYADDHLHTLSVGRSEDIMGILDVYNRYTMVSGLCINPVKTELLTINTDPALVQNITNTTGITPVDKLTLLGIRLANTYDGCIRATYEHIDTKAILRKIRITAKATHMLHRRLIIHATLAPMYMHAFMALGSTPEVNKQIANIIKQGMWTQIAGPDAKQLRIQVAFQRVFAGYEMGGLNIAHPQQVCEGLMLNTLERLIQKEREHNEAPEAAPNIVRILAGLVAHTGCTELHKILQHGGAQAWRHAAARVNAHSRYLGGCMFSMARFCGKLEHRQATWHAAPLWGHTCNNPITPVTEQDSDALRRAGIYTVGQIFNPGDGITVHSHLPAIPKPGAITACLWNKVLYIKRTLAGKQILRQGIHITENAIQIVRRTGTYSHVNRQLYKEEAAKEIKAPPSFYTRRQDGQPLPALNRYCQAYEKLMTCSHTTTVATAFNFAVLNRTVWTGKKQALSGNAGGGRQDEPLTTGTCDLCDTLEDTAHILTDCNGYSYRLWERFNRHLTIACRTLNPTNGMIHVTYNNIMYFTDITGLPQAYRRKVLALIIELKRDIYVRRTERCAEREVARDGLPAGRNRLYTDQRLDMHISIACLRIARMCQHKGKDAGILDTIRESCLAD